MSEDILDCVCFPTHGDLVSWTRPPRQAQAGTKINFSARLTTSIAGSFLGTPTGVCVCARARVRACVRAYIDVMPVDIYAFAPTRPSTLAFRGRVDIV